MDGRYSLTTLVVPRENYLTLEEHGASLPQIRSGLATAIDSEAGATRIISEDDLGHEF